MTILPLKRTSHKSEVAWSFISRDSHFYIYAELPYLVCYY